MRVFRFLLSSPLLLFGLAGFLSCERPEQPEKPEEPIELPPQRVEAISFQQELSLVQLIPELESNPYIQEEKDGFVIPLGTQSWSETYSVDQLFLPAQTSVPVLLTAEQTSPGDRTCKLSTTGFIIMSVILPDGCSRFDFTSCEGTFRLHFALDDNSPYRKVNLTKTSIKFPSWLRATPVGGSIPSLELTKEGTDIEFNLTSLYDPVGFMGEDGEWYLSAQTGFSATILAYAEDALDPSAEPPSTLRLKCTFESGRIDFGATGLAFSELDFPEKELKGAPVPCPSFLLGKGSAIQFDGPRILIHYVQDFPFSGYFKGSFPDLRDNPAFTLTTSGNYLLMPELDGWYRQGIEDKDVPALKELLRTPASDGTLTPRMTARPVVLKAGVITPGKEYRLTMDAEWSLPLTFTGKITGISEQTETLHLDGDALDAPGAGTHEIGVTLMNQLPFDCIVTPVFILEGKDPVYLDDFLIEAWGGVNPWFRHAFTPGRDHWKASLHFIITPTEGRGIQFRRSLSFILKDTTITINKRAES